MKSAEMIKNRIGNARCAVLGFGVSNIPLVELLAECGNEITVHDKCDFERLDARAKGLAERGVRFVCGEDYLAHIDADIIFRSPGIRPDYPCIVKAVENGAENPLSIIAGIKTAPSAATVAGPEPEIAPKKHATITHTIAIPPRL